MKIKTKVQYFPISSEQHWINVLGGNINIQTTYTPETEHCPNCKANITRANRLVMHGKTYCNECK